MTRLEELRDAYACDVIELDEFEEAVALVLEGQEVPRATKTKLYDRFLIERISDAPGAVIMFDSSYP